MPKTVDTRKHCKVYRVESMQQSSTTPSLHLCVFRDYRRLLHVLNPTLQCFLVSTVFGAVSSLHLTSYLMIFTLVRYKYDSAASSAAVL